MNSATSGSPPDPKEERAKVLLEDSKASAKAASEDGEVKEADPSKSANTSDSSSAVLPMSLIKALGRKTSSLGGSNGSSNGSGNNSDNSALVSIENGSFGFNFDPDEAMINPSSLGGSGGSDGGSRDSSSPSDNGTSSGPSKKSSSELMASRGAGTRTRRGVTVRESVSAPVGGGTTSSSSGTTGKSSLTIPTHEAAAAAAVANLHSIASSYSSVPEKSADQVSSSANLKPSAKPKTSSARSKRSAGSSVGEDDSGGYNSDDSSDNAEPFDERTIGRPKKRKKKLDESKREERNAREKERSFRISKQITELRNLLSSGGVIVPKGTKSSVLSEAANYIRVLQQHQYRSEIDRHQLVQQVQMIGGGALGSQAATAVRHVAAQNGVWSLGNFGGVPPKSAMSFQGASSDASSSPADVDSALSPSIAEHEYRFVFNSCSVGMAIASMGGAFIDCNSLFCQLSGFTKQEVCSMTVFNLTSQEDLQQAFDLISQMISPPADARLANQPPKPCVLRGKMKERGGLGLSVALIRDEDKIAKCFCVTLINNPSSPYDPTKPTPATADLIMSQTASLSKGGQGRLSSGHAYTTG